jgi:hypothetical protein
MASVPGKRMARSFGLHEQLLLRVPKTFFELMT